MIPLTNTELFTLTIEVEREDDGTYMVGAPQCNAFSLTRIARCAIASVVQSMADEFELAREEQALATKACEKFHEARES